jgi:hypothetical protein
VLFGQLPEPIDLELDLKNRCLYWTDRGDPPRGNTVNRRPDEGRTGPFVPRQHRRPFVRSSIRSNLIVFAAATRDGTVISVLRLELLSLRAAKSVTNIRLLGTSRAMPIPSIRCVIRISGTAFLSMSRSFGCSRGFRTASQQIRVLDFRCQ